MDHQHAGRALARGFLVLVGPATVVGHGLAAEVAFAGLVVGVVDQHQRALALQVDALEVVPAALGRGYAVAYEHDRRIHDLDLPGAVHPRSPRYLPPLVVPARLAVYSS